MDKFEIEELKKERKIVKNIWFNWLIHYICKPIKNLQDKVLSLYNSKTNKIVRRNKKS